MKDYYSDTSFTQQAKDDFITTGRSNAFLRQVYLTMAVGLALTGAMAWYFAQTGLVYSLYTPTGPSMLGYVVMFSPFIFVLALSFGIEKMSFTVASVVFGIYSVVMGMSLSSIFLVYSLGSIGTVFFISAGMFGAMAFAGMVTKADLSKFGSFLFMGLIGIIIASVVNMFLGSSMMDYIISFAGVAIFLGLTAYDTQRLMQIGMHADMTQESYRKASVMGALALYLDFINLFLFLLRLFGSRD